MRSLPFFALALVAASPAAAATFQTTIPTGTLVDLSGFTPNTPIAADAQAFLDAGIASITVDSRRSNNNERYDAGTTFGAGRALFNLESGDLIALDEGSPRGNPDFGSPTFTIDFVGATTSFGFRLADTSSSFVTPLFQTFRGSVETASETFTGFYNAQTEFGFVDPLGIERIVISTEDTDGYGVTDLTVGAAVDTVTPIPVPAAAPLLAAGLALMMGLRRRR